MVQLRSLFFAAALTGPIFVVAFPENDVYEARAITPAPADATAHPAIHEIAAVSSIKGEKGGVAPAKGKSRFRVTLTPNKHTHRKGPKLTKASTPKFKAAPHKFPKGTWALAHDEEKAMFHAFDTSMKKLGSVPTGGQPKKATANGPPSKAVAPAKAADAAQKIHKRGATGTCSPLTAEQAQALPGWSKMQAVAKANWGGGSYNVVTNPTDISGSPANSCVQSDPVIVSTKGNPTCQTQTSSTGGTLAGTTGTVTLSQEQGTTYSLTSTVTTSASISVGETVSVSIGFPDIADVEASETVTGTFTNEQSKAVTNTLENTQTATVSIDATNGQKCSLNFQSKTCNSNGSGSVAFIASGFVWFNFNDATNGHYKWALSLDDTLPNVNDRSSSAAFNMVISSASKSNYTGNCS